MATPSFEQQLKLTHLEAEIITLKATLSMINGMVNHQMMIFDFQDPDSTIRFHTEIHMAHFNLLLVDFLSTPTGFFCGGKNYLDRLQDICKSSQLSDQCINSLKESVENFIDWLSTKVIIEKLWLPSINLEIELSLERKEFIIMCGNISKHNPTQLTRQAKKFSNILKDNSYSIETDQVLIALEDFYEHFHRDVFLYHSSTIAEFLNNICWGIYTYVNPELKRCVEVSKDYNSDLLKYNYKYPSEIISDLGKKFYWNLMSDVINPPFIERFEVTKYLKMRF